MKPAQILPRAGTDAGVTYTVRAPSELDRPRLSGLIGLYLTEQRLSLAEFVVTAGYPGLPPIGIVLAEMPWGEVGRQWQRHVPDALEIGGLFIQDPWRKTHVPMGLIGAAARHAAASGRVPVGVTEVGSVTAALLATRGALPRRRFRAGGVDYRPWILTGMAA